MDVMEKIAGVLSALGYTPEELVTYLNCTEHRAKSLLKGTARHMYFKEYCNICVMLGTDANFFYFKGGKFINE